MGAAARQPCRWLRCALLLVLAMPQSTFTWPNTDFESGVKITMEDIAIAIEFSDFHFYDSIKVQGKDGRASYSSRGRFCCSWNGSSSIMVVVHFREAASAEPKYRGHHVKLVC